MDSATSSRTVSSPSTRSTAWSRLKKRIGAISGITALSLLSIAGAAEAAPSLLLDKKVNNSTPTAGQLFTYTIRYRCASVTEDCLDAVITDAISSDLNIIGFSGAGGNIVSSGETGGTITWELGSGGSSALLDAGASGVLKVNVAFPANDCEGPVPAAGTVIDNVATFAASNASSTSSSGPAEDVITPAIPVCPPPPPPPSSDLGKLSSAPNQVMPGTSLTVFKVTYPEATAGGGGYVLEDVWSPDVSPIQIQLPTGWSTVDVLCGGVWYSDVLWPGST